MNRHSYLPEEQLLSHIKEGDKTAFEALYTRFWRPLYIYACKLVSEQEAEDMVQEIFTSLWTKRQELAITSSVANYLYTAVRYRIFDHFDHKKVRRDHYIASLQNFIDQGSCITDEQVRERELQKIIDTEIRQLPAKMRQVFELSRQSFLSQREIAEQLNISEKTVKKQIGNSIKVLRQRVMSLLTALL
jgi:RNA polymerase sigma-70 factor (ECF subfamily)